MQLLLGEAGVSRVQQERLLAMQACGNHLLMLINDVLDLTKIEAGELDVHLAEVNVTTVMDAIGQILLQRASQKNLNLTFAVGRDVPEWIMADDTKLRQILVNLVGNAVKFTYQGSVDVLVEARGHELCFSVNDTGMGISEQQMVHIFDPFHQAEGGHREGGTGLGLAISQRLARVMSGRLEAYSEIGVGSRFDLYLPLQAVDAEGRGLGILHWTWKATTWCRSGILKFW